jgi:dUTP pyrophosphatase
MILEYFCLPHCEHKPVRANPSDAGLDLCFNAHQDPWNARMDGTVIEDLVISPGESVVLPTGLKFGIPHGYMLQIMNRSGNAAKKQLMVGACVVDSGYDGEVFVNLHNIGSEEQFIQSGMKIAQAVLIPVVHARFVETSEDNLYDWHPITISDRGDGALGSTGD